MSIIGFIASAMFTLGLIISIKRGFDGDYDKSHKAEITCILWLIVALICFK